MNMSERIAYAISQSGKKKGEIAAECGVSNSAVSQWLAGSSKTMKPENLYALAEATGFLPKWLALGEGPKKKPEPNVIAGPDLTAKVPLISWVQAGNWQEINLYQPVETYYYCPVPHSEHTFALKVRGASMENPHSRKSFFDGDIIFVDPEKCADHNSLVVVKLDESNEATFKQLIIEGEERYLKALNPAWPEQMIKINGNATICGVVVARLDIF